MAILSNGKFYGFLCSVKETGQKLANGVKEYVEDFVSGFTGHGWKLWEYVKGKWKLEIDTIVVRETMLVFEMLISKIRAIIGAQAITQGHGKVKSVRVSDDGTEYLIELEDEDMSIVAHDFVRCQTFTGNTTKLYHVEVSSVDTETRTLHVPLTEFDQNEAGNVLNPPSAGDELVQFGNSQNRARQSAIYMHADETGQPAIDVMFDIDSKNWDGKVKVRVGGDIPGANGLKGFYCVNGMIKSVDDKGATIYEFSPNGAVNIGKGNITYNPTTNKVTLGSGVTLTWDNLSDESKENLKGEPGQDGLNGQDGADGVNGADGVSLVYKGEFASHPDNPENGWYYRNTSDKKCYVYQDNAWYVMTVDGSDGKNGLDGVNGKDGNDGLDIVWKGDSSTPPANPQKNWVYRDTDNGRVYIYNGMAWQLMVADGNDGVDGTDGVPGADGTDGMSVYVTYHDSESEPIKPTGDGTTGGWHTDATNAVVWMSQKVSDSASTGDWGNPIKIKGDIGKPGQDANLLPWIEEWNNNKTQIGDNYLISPKIFSGTNNGTPESPLFTGVAIGRDVVTINGEQKSGLFGIKNNQTTFELNALTGNALYKGKVQVRQQDGEGVIIDPASNDIRIYDNESNNVLTIEGATRNNIEEIFGSNVSVATKNVPLSIENNLEVESEISDVFQTKGIVTINSSLSYIFSSGVETYYSISIKIESYSDNTLSNLIKTATIFEDYRNYTTYNSQMVEGLSVNIGAGFHRIVAKLKREAKGTDYRYFYKLESFRCIVITGNYISSLFGNGLAMGTSNSNIFAFVNEHTPLGSNRIRGTIANDNCGLKLGESDLYTKRNNVWYKLPAILCSGQAVFYYDYDGRFDGEIVHCNSYNGDIPTIESILSIYHMNIPQSWRNDGFSTSTCFIQITPINSSVIYLHSMTDSSFLFSFNTFDDLLRQGKHPVFFEIKRY